MFHFRFFSLPCFRFLPFSTQNCKCPIHCNEFQCFEVCLKLEISTSYSHSYPTSIFFSFSIDMCKVRPGYYQSVFYHRPHRSFTPLPIILAQKFSEVAVMQTTSPHTRQSYGCGAIRTQVNELHCKQQKSIDNCLQISVT